VSDADLWIRGSIWVALTLYVAGEAVAALRSVPGSGWSRGLSTAGCAAFLIHVLAAFQLHYHWSHQIALEETARQTAAMVGLNSGGGLYVNYTFALVWIGEVLWQWWSSDTYRRRHDWLARGVRVFFLFMMVNGAVVFVRSPQRWFGGVLCLLLVTVWVVAWRHARPRPG